MLDWQLDMSKLRAEVSFGSFLVISKIKTIKAIRMCSVLVADMTLCCPSISKFGSLTYEQFRNDFYNMKLLFINRKQAHNRGVTVPNRNISGAGLSFALDKILSVLSTSHGEDSKRTDVVVCVSGIRPNFRDVTQILRSMWSSGIQCAVVQANNPEDCQDMAKDLGAIFYVVYTEDSTLRVRSWINDRFEERLLNKDEIVVYVKKALRPEPEQQSTTLQQSVSINESNKYSRSAESTPPAVDIIFSTIEKMTSSSRKRHENFLTNHMSESLLLFNKKVQITVIVVDLQSIIIRAIIAAIDPRGNSSSKEIDAEISYVIDRFPNYKRYIRDVVEEITDIYSEKKSEQVVCLYNLKDGYYRIIL